MVDGVWFPCLVCMIVWACILFTKSTPSLAPGSYSYYVHICVIYHDGGFAKDAGDLGKWCS
jgi:hypothetical protein